MSRRILLVGAGEHARVVADALRAGHRLGQVAGFVDPDAGESLAAAFSLTRIGTDDDVDLKREEYMAVLCFGGVTAVSRRRAAVARLGGKVHGWETVIHPATTIAADVRIGAGTTIMAGAILNTGAVVGVHCIVNTGAIIEHDVVLEDHVQVSPGAVLGGAARIGAGAYIGLGARVRDHLTVGAGAIVGMGAVVVRDVLHGATVLGVPARGP
jgi:acetyltransferase EpsM